MQFGILVVFTESRCIKFIGKHQMIFDSSTAEDTDPKRCERPRTTNYLKKNV